jgi:hypothetical protein
MVMEKDGSVCLGDSRIRRTCFPLQRHSFSRAPLVELPKLSLQSFVEVSMDNEWMLQFTL